MARPHMVVKNVRQGEGRALLEMLDALRQGAQGSITVRVLASTDHDGVCAAKILQKLLPRAGVKYDVAPVTCNTDVTEQLAILESNEEVRSVVMLNCGAGLDIQRILEESGVGPEVRCFMIDAHRPFNVANLSSRNQRVVVLDDDPTANAVRPPVDEDDEEAPSEDEGEINSDAEKEDLWTPDGAPAPPGPTAAERRAGKRRRELDRQERSEAKRQRLNDYYLTSYYAMPAAMSLFKLARQTGPPSEDMLWLAAVSLVGYQELGLLGEVEFHRLMWEELKEAMDSAADFAATPSQGAGSTVPESTHGSDEEADPAPRRRRPPQRLDQGRRRLRFETDLRLVLYRHWDLENSVMHTGYFNGALDLSRDKGKRALKELFATASITPSDYRQMYSTMTLRTRKNLLNSFRDHGRTFGLTEKMFLEQFVRDLGPISETTSTLLEQELSCIDAVHILTALLSSVPQSLSSARADSLPKTADGRRDTAAIFEVERQAMGANFWRAWDAVLATDAAPVREGIIEGVEVAKQVLSMAQFIKASKAMHSARRFRWVKIEKPPHLFRHHLAVRRLAVWLLQAPLGPRTRSDGPEKPLLVIVRDEVRNTYLCVGATPIRFSEQDEFGALFRNVLRADRSVKFRYDFFDKSVIEVAAEDFERFWELVLGARA